MTTRPLSLCLAILITGLAASAQNVSPVAPLTEPITTQERLAWFGDAAVGPSNLLGGLAGAGFDTLRNSPPEYGPHWDGFGKRYGIRVSTRVISSGIEAGVGALWGEDPRYYRVPERPFAMRIGNVVRMTFVTHNSSGREIPSYARFIAAPSSAFLSNAWVPDSQRSTGDALNRIGSSFADQMISNALSEFWPDVRRHLWHRNQKTDPLTGLPTS